MYNIFQVPNKERNYQGYMVYVLSILWSVVTGVTVSFGFYFFPEIWTRWATLLAISLFIGITNLTINSLGHSRAASWSLTLMVWLYITIPCYSAGGIMAPGIMSQMSVILTAGFLLGWRGGLMCGLFTVGVDFMFAYMEVTGHLPQPTVVHNPLTRWIAAAIPFGTILSLQYYATNHLRASLDTLQQEIIKREEAEKVKDEILHNLQERVKELKTLYVVGNILRKDETSSEKTFRKIVEMLPHGWQYPDITAARISIAGKNYSTNNYAHSDQMLFAKTTTTKGINLEIEIVYLKTMPVADEGAFLKEERNLIDMLAEMLKNHLEQQEKTTELRESEQLLRKITSQVPGNAYMFEINEDGLPNVLFMNHGTNPFNHRFNIENSLIDPQKPWEIVHEDDIDKFDNAMQEASRAHSPLSFQYRVVINDQVQWRWMQAVPETEKDGRVVWYGASSDITPLVDYLTSIEQIIFDIAHVIRRPTCTMLGMTKLIIDDELTESELKEYSGSLYQIAMEMDEFIRELMAAYQQKKESTELNINITSSIDKRDSLFN